MAAMWSPIIGLLLLLLPLAPSSCSHIMYPLEGDVYPTGHIVVKLNIGEPPLPYYLDIDTGSNVTWLECHHPAHGCVDCSPGPSYYYRPALSNLRVDCKDPFCAALHADLPGVNPACAKEDPHQCHYKIGYASGTTEGVLSNDTITLREGNSEYIVFGCGYKQKRRNPLQKPTAVQGLLGLGRGRVGFVAQLKKQNVISKDVIGHCLSMKEGGYLFIGDYDYPSAGITWAPMRKYDFFYTPGQGTLHLDGQQVYANGMDVVFDSGATYTYVPVRIYEPLVAKVRHILGDADAEVQDLDLPLCWGRKKPFGSLDEAKNVFKPLTLRFDNNIVMNMPVRKYLVLTKAGNLCMGILNGTELGQDQRIIIGDVTMRDMLVVYDNERGMLGWVHRTCPSRL
ncbi:unnamed protein product [Alopecurus aequalis]